MSEPTTGVRGEQDASGYSQSISCEPFVLCQVQHFLPIAHCERLHKTGDKLRTSGALDVFGHQSWTYPIGKFAKACGGSAEQWLQKLSNSPPDIGLDNLHYESGVYARLESGGRHMLHADAVDLSGSANHTPNRRAVVIVYLREYGVDYQGGELHFPLLRQCVCPAAGLMVCFPSTLGYQHAVNPVISGVRDTIAIWYQ